MRFFEKQVDRRSQNAMVSFLSEHQRYNKRYANCVKVHSLGLTTELLDRAYELLASDDDIWDYLEEAIANFTQRHNGYYTISSAGRLGGYLMLCRSRYEEQGYKSICRSCGQCSYKSVAEMPIDPVERIIAQEILRNDAIWTASTYLQQSAISDLPGTDEDKLAVIRRLKTSLENCTASNKCGRCRAEGEKGRKNLTSPITRLVVLPSNYDEDPEFSEWSLSRLREQVNLVCDFDRTCDEIRSDFIEMCKHCKVEKETIMVPKTVRRLTCGQ